MSLQRQIERARLKEKVKRYNKNEENKKDKLEFKKVWRQGSQQTESNKRKRRRK